MAKKKADGHNQTTYQDDGGPECDHPGSARQPVTAMGPVRFITHERSLLPSDLRYKKKILFIQKANVSCVFFIIFNATSKKAGSQVFYALF